MNTRERRCKDGFFSCLTHQTITNNSHCQTVRGIISAGTNTLVSHSHAVGITIGVLDHAKQKDLGDHQALKCATLPGLSSTLTIGLVGNEPPGLVVKGVLLANLVQIKAGGIQLQDVLGLFS